ncbi:MAG: citramalate synthase [Kiritimatiellia bacterium]
MKKQTVRIYDSTLRDGAQAEGVSLSLASKIKLARRLDAWGVHYIEGGYAGSNEKDMAFFREISKKPLSHARLAAFGSTRRRKTKVREDAFVKSLLEAGTPAVTVVGKAWKLHVKDVLRTTRSENLAMVGDTVEFLKERGKEVIFDAEHFFDGYKDDPEFAVSVVNKAVSAGADMIVPCDTNGGTMPEEIYDVMQTLNNELRVPLGIHAHNDSGLALACSLAAVRAGARQVQGTINGHGERCGNANLCSVVPNLMLKMGYKCVAPKSLRNLRELSLYVDDLINLRPDTKAPYVGQSAFSHKGGAHVNAVEKNPRTYEHIDPELVGNRRRSLISELSGGSNVVLKAIEMGVSKKESVNGARDILKELKKLESKGYAFEAADASFRILIQKVLKEHKPFFDLEGFRVIVEKRDKDTPCLSEATIKVRVKDEAEQMVAEGDGPVHALDKALRKALVRFYPPIAKVFLTDFRVRILDPEDATAAKTRVLIESSDGRETWGTVGVSENIIEASWEALVDSVEYKLFKDEEAGRRGNNSKS